MMVSRMHAHVAAVLAAAAMALAAPACAAFDEWTDGQQGKAAGLAALHIANWGQNRAMAYNDRTVSIDGMKGNTLPGSSAGPSRLIYGEADYDKVDRRFLLSAAIGAGVLHALPSSWRNQALNVGLVIEAGMVGRQLQMGVGWRF
jgi:hypothetical protein